MRSYETRRSDGVNRNYLLPSDEAAISYAAGITERGLEVEVWLAHERLATVVGTLAALPSGALEFDRPTGSEGSPVSRRQQ